MHLFIYIRDNTNQGLKDYSDMKDAPLFDLLRQANNKTEKHLMVFLILVGNIFQTQEEVQEYILYL